MFVDVSSRCPRKEPYLIELFSSELQQNQPAARRLAASIRTRSRPLDITKRVPSQPSTLRMLRLYLRPVHTPVKTSAEAEAPMYLTDVVMTGNVQCPVAVFMRLQKSTHNRYRASTRTFRVSQKNLRTIETALALKLFQLYDSVPLFLYVQRRLVCVHGYQPLRRCQY